MGQLYCENCDITYGDDYEFCPECGERLTVKTEPVTSSSGQGKKRCSNCGFEVSDEYVFCPECGES